jgi:hypothetical protein
MCTKYHRQLQNANDHFIMIKVIQQGGWNTAELKQLVQITSPSRTTVRYYDRGWSVY